MSELVVGILLAILASTVIPWVTSLASAWLEARRDMKNRRRELFEKAFVANKMDGFRTTSVDEQERNRDIQANFDEKNRTSLALRSTFGLLDKNVASVTEGRAITETGTPEHEVLRLWANGHLWVARWKARKLAKQTANISSEPTQPQ